MPSAIQLQVQRDRIEALKSKDRRLSTAISLILAAFKQQEVDTRCVLDDLAVFSIFDKMLKERRQSLNQYLDAKRQDLAEQERFEIDLLLSYLPPLLSDVELNELIKQAVLTCNATSLKAMGQVLATLKPQVQGRADMALVSQKVKNSLSPV